MDLPAYVPLPPPHACLGPVEATWEEIDPGVALIRVHGGTADDRALVHHLLRVELAHHGIEHAQFHFGRPVDESYWHDESEPERKWGSLYHGASRWTHSKILREGLIPWDEPAGFGRGHNWVPGLAPRPGHVYLTQDPHEAGRLGPGDQITDNLVYEIDPAYLEPERINPDEDSYHERRVDYPVERTPDGKSRGEWAQEAGLGDDPAETRDILEDSETHALAYKGRIPPEAIRGWHTPLHGGGWSPTTPNPAYQAVMARTAHWGDIEQKAKRLILSGQVQILRNSRNAVVAYVIGDHGEYNCEFSRDDPESWTMTQWHCECPWNQYAFQRTRQWKKYEARPCAHVLATFWAARRVPLDEALAPGDKLPRGHKGFPGQGPDNLGLEQQVFTPQDTQMMAPPEPAAPPEAPPEPTPAPAGSGAPPGPSAGPPEALGPPDLNVIPPQPLMPGQPLPPPVPGTTPGGMASPPNAVSVPGAKQPTPFNPVQYPGGTYSALQTYYHGTNIALQPGDSIRPQALTGTPTEFAQHDYYDPYVVYLTTQDHLAERYAVGRAGRLGGEPHVYEVRPLGGCWPDPEAESGFGTDQHCSNLAEVVREIPLPGFVRWEDGSMRRVPRAERTAAQAQFENGMKVKLLTPQYGLAEGKSDAHGAGQYQEIHAGTHGEVLSQDATTGWVEVIFPLHQSGPLEPYHVRSFLDGKELRIIEYPPGSPFVQRRGPHT